MANIKINLNDIINNSYNNITVIKFLREDKTKRPYKYYYQCKCTCGNIKEITRTNIISGHALSCGCLRYKTGKLNKTWKGYEEISSSFFTSIKRHALERNLIFDITIEDAWNQYIKQNKKCALTNLDLILEKIKNRTASLDRINNNIGYTKDNIQWVHKDINWMKGTFTQDEFISLCKMVSLNN